MPNREERDATIARVNDHDTKAASLLRHFDTVKKSEAARIVVRTVPCAWFLLVCVVLTIVAWRLHSLARRHTAQMDDLERHVVHLTDGTQVADLRQAISTLAVAKRGYDDTHVFHPALSSQQLGAHLLVLTCGARCGSCRELASNWGADSDASFQRLLDAMSSKIEAAEAVLAEAALPHRRSHRGRRRSTLASLAVQNAITKLDEAERSSQSTTPRAESPGAARTLSQSLPSPRTQVAAKLQRGVAGGDAAAAVATMPRRPPSLRASHTFHLGDGSTKRMKTAATLHSLYTLGRKIGSGAFAVVYEVKTSARCVVACGLCLTHRCLRVGWVQAVHKASGKRVAVKCVKKSLLSKRDRLDLETEVRHLRRVRCAHCCTRCTRFCVVSMVVSLMVYAHPCCRGAVANASEHRWNQGRVQW